MNLYYEIWVDCIGRMRTIEANKNNWKIKGLVFITLAMTFNLVFIMSIFQRDVLGFYFFEIDISSFSEFENYIATVLLLYMFPCLILNYLLIFFRKRYVFLQKKYKYRNGKLCAIYYLISFFPPIIFLLYEYSMFCIEIFRK